MCGSACFRNQDSTMLKLASIAVIGLATLASAQSPLVTGLTPNNQGNIGGGLYFNLRVMVPITITELNFGIGGNIAAGTACSVEIWLGPQSYVGNVTDPSLWVQVGATTPYTKLAAGYEIATGATVIPAGANPNPLSLGVGEYGISLRSVGCSHGYTNGTGCAGSAPPGSCSNATHTTTELQLRGGQAQNAFLAGGVFSPRIFAGNIHYTLGGTPIAFAARESYGDGCYSNYQSWYEYWPNPASIDYANTSLLMTYNGATNSYDSTLGTTPIDTVALTNPPLGHGADGDILVPVAQPILYAGQQTLDLAFNVNMNADGFITFEGAFPSLWTGANVVPDIFAGAMPLPATPAQIPASVGNFKFLDPSLGGTTHYDFTGTEHLFTWQNVNDTGGGGPNNFQIACSATGDIEIRWGAMSVGGGGGNPAVVGYFVAGGALDPGSIDFTAAAPFSTQGNDSNPLLLASDVNPVIGTTVNLTVADQAPNPGIGVTFITTVQVAPGFDLGIIGAPGCLANVDINFGAGFAIDSIPVNGLTLAFPIPANPANVGLSFFCQSIWLNPTANAFGLVTSNGLRLRIGSF